MVEIYELNVRKLMSRKVKMKSANDARQIDNNNTTLSSHAKPTVMKKNQNDT